MQLSRKGVQKEAKALFVLKLGSNWKILQGMVFNGFLLLNDVKSNT